MSTNSRKILVPFDYSQLSDNAVKYAVLIAKTVEAEIVLLHVIENLNEESNAQNKLLEIAESITDKYGVKVEILIRAGIVYKVIKIAAVTIDAFMVVMKTQAPIGKEKYTRSRSIRVMTGSKIPFIVIQDPPKRLAFRKVVFPIDFRRENKEKLVWISTLSKYYTSKIYLFKPDISDYRVRNNLGFAKRFLEGKNITYEIITGKKSSSSADETLEYAQKIDAQLIIIMMRKKIGFLSGLFGYNEQKYISNKYKIPVMCLNPRIELHKYEGFI